MTKINQNYATKNLFVDLLGLLVLTSKKTKKEKKR